MLRASVAFRPDTRASRGDRRGIRVHAHRVHAILDHRVERAGQFALVHVVLILADADRLRVDLHQFRERILQTARNRHRAAQRHVHVREFLRREFRGRVDRRARFRHDDLLQLEFRMTRDQFARELVRFARRRAVADTDQLSLRLRADAREFRDRAVPVAARLVRIDHVGGEHFAGPIDHRDFHAGAHARIEADHGLRAGGRGQQQVLQIAREHADRFVFGFVAQIRQQFVFDMRLHLHAPAPAAHVGEPLVGRAVLIGDAEVARDQRFARMRHLRVEFFAEAQLDHQHARIAAAEQGQRAMRRHGVDGFRVVVVVAEFLFFRAFLAFDHLRRHARPG